MNKTTPIRDDLRPALIGKLTDILGRISLSNNFFIDSTPFRELADIDERFAKKQNGRRSQDYVSERPLEDFMFEFLSEEIQSTRTYDSDAEELPLSKIEEYRDLPSVAERLVSEFESLPRHYKLFIRLPVWGLKEILSAERVELSDSLSLINPGQEFTATFTPPIYRPRRRNPFSFLFSLEAREPRLDWQSYYVYCEINVEGFVGIYEDTTPIKSADFLVRALCGLGLVLQLFEMNYSPTLDDVYLKIYESNGDKWDAKKARLLSTELAQGLEKLSLQGPFTPTITPRQRYALNEIKRLFSNEQKYEKLLRAARWYFDSYCGDNELLAFVKATICLEMLLGEKKLSEKTGVMELIRTRCAYLIGLDHTDREQIEKDFTEIYKTRSNIVHNGQDRLTKPEKESLYKLRWLCYRVIKKEIDLTSGT